MRTERDIVEKSMHAKGKSSLLKHLDGGRLTQKEAIEAHCYDCTGYYEDGKNDCANIGCPLYAFMPYNPNRRKAVERSGKADRE